MSLTSSGHHTCLHLFRKTHPALRPAPQTVSDERGGGEGTMGPTCCTSDTHLNVTNEEAADLVRTSVCPCSILTFSHDSLALQCSSASRLCRVGAEREEGPSLHRYHVWGQDLIIGGQEAVITPHVRWQERRQESVASSHTVDPGPPCRLLNNLASSMSTRGNSAPAPPCPPHIEAEPKLQPREQVAAWCDGGCRRTDKQSSA